MPGIGDWLPTLPGQGPPLPQWMTRRHDTPTTTLVQHAGCENGISCIKDHMGRAHLYMNEAIRFSSAGTITPEARQKVRLARAELQCEDDFQAAMGSPAAVRAEVLRLLASCRSTWKAMDSCGVDTASGTIEDLQELQNAIQALWNKAYEIETRYQLSRKEESSNGQS